MSENPMIPVFDGHNDTLLSLISTGRDFYAEGDVGHVDMPRAKKGGFVGGFFATFVPTPGDKWTPNLEPILGKSVNGVALADENGSPSLAYAQMFTNAMVARLLNLESGGGNMLRELDREDGHVWTDDPLSIVTFAEDLEDNIEAGVMSAIMHFEGAEMIDENFYALEMYHNAGLRGSRRCIVRHIFRAAQLVGCRFSGRCQVRVMNSLLHKPEANSSPAKPCS